MGPRYRRRFVCCDLPEHFEDCRIRPADTHYRFSRWIAYAGHQMDPLPISTKLIEFYRRFLFDVYGDLMLRAGLLKGLKTLHRSGDFFRVRNRDSMRMAVNLAAGNIEFESYAELMLFDIDIPGFVLHIDIDYIQTYIEFCYNSFSGAECILHDIKITNAKGMRLWISGWRYLDWIINPVIAFVVRFYKTSILNWIQEEMEDAINVGFYGFQLPLMFRVSPNRR